MSAYVALVIFIASLFLPLIFSNGYGYFRDLLLAYYAIVVIAFLSLSTLAVIVALGWATGMYEFY